MSDEMPSAGGDQLPAVAEALAVLRPPGRTGVRVLPVDAVYPERRRLHRVGMRKGL
ncbi:hypothetical protein ACF09K_19685 [Streptomyces sp. NPDC014882]|uniref:hypothetical protein n=1 Tax=Streptomyces sp. NPDC014882 TaxID=3364927 RepID=UPI0036F5FEAB